MSRACAGCLELIQPEDMVMWLRDHVVCGGTGNHTVYHTRCFACARCDGGRPLTAGEQYGTQHGRVYCRAHYYEIQLESTRVHGAVTKTATVRRTGTRGRPRKHGLPLIREASPGDCEMPVALVDMEPRKFSSI